MSLCNLVDHHWTPVRGGKYTRCTACQTFFPCKHECRHLDCRLARSGRAHELHIELRGWPLRPDPFTPTEEP